MIAFLVTVAVMTYIVRYVKIDVTTAGTTTATAIAAQWLVPIGVLITLVVGAVSSRFHPAPETPYDHGRTDEVDDDAAAPAGRA